MVASDLNEIQSETIQAALDETVQKQLNTSKYNIHLSSASESGANNFLGIVYRVEFHPENNTKNDFENEKSSPSKLILKVAPTNEARRAQFPTRLCFLRENYMYDNVLPFFRNFEQSKGVITEENGFIEYPKCYGNVDAELNECIILEDLSVRGFSIIDRYTQEISADHVRLIMESLGKFHAISFALKDQQPDKFNELASPLDEIFIRRDDAFVQEYFTSQSKAALEILTAEEDAHLLKKIKKIFEHGVLDIAADCLDLESTGAASIITHGDIWQNNTMFRYDKDGKPIEISLIDWQLSRHSSPIIDIVYFMFCCTTKQLRDAHYENFLKIYHESLSAHIQRLGSDPEKLFPYELMLKHFQKFAKFGLVLAMAMLPMVTAESGTEINIDELCDDMKNGKEMDMDIFTTEKSVKKFHERLRGVIIDMDRLEYI